MIKIVKDLVAPANWKFWILFGMVIKAVQIVVFLPILLNLNHGGHPLVKFAGDSYSYIQMAENFISDGEWYITNGTVKGEVVRNIELNSDPNYGSTKNYTYRMPGYAFFLSLPIRLFGLETGLLVVIALQILASAISGYLLCLMCYKESKKDWVFFGLYAVLIGGFYLGKWSMYIMSEAMSISFLFISLYLVFYGGKKHANLLFIIAGILAAWAIFMRPFFAPTIALIGLVLFIKVLKKQQRWSLLLAFTLPIIVAQSAWVIRNATITNRFVLFEDTLAGLENGNQSWRAWVQYTKSHGEFWGYWEPNCMGAWIIPDSFFTEQGVEAPGQSILPESITSSPDLMQKLNEVKQGFELCQDQSINLEERLSIERQNVRTLDSLNSLYVSQNVFESQVQSRMKVFEEFAFQPLDLSYRALKYPVNVLTTFALTALYTLVVVGGFWSILMLLLNPSLITGKPITLFSVFVPTLTVLMFVVYWKVGETRQFTNAFPFLACALALVLSNEKVNRFVRLFTLIVVVVSSVGYGGYALSSHISW